MFGVSFQAISFIFIGPDKGITGIDHHLWIMITSWAVCGVSASFLYYL